MIRNLLFDLDDTLLDFRRAEKNAVSQTASQLGIPPSPAFLERYSSVNAALWKELEQGTIVRRELKVRRFRILFREFGYDADPAEAARLYEAALSKQCIPMEGSTELLKSLASHFRIYLVTNGTACVQKSRIESSGFFPYLSGVFISELIGADKPQPAFFDCCFSKIPDFSRRETLIIGDSLSSDIRGGINAGIRTVWYNPSHQRCPDGIAPDFEVHTLPELKVLLESTDIGDPKESLNPSTEPKYDRKGCSMT